jgi:hypothetical protein
MLDFKNNINLFIFNNLAEASGGRTCKDVDNKGNPLESVVLSDENLNIRRGLAQF